MPKPDRKQLLEDLREALKKEKPSNRKAFLRGWKTLDEHFRKHRRYDKGD